MGVITSLTIVINHVGGFVITERLTDIFPNIAHLRGYSDEMQSSRDMVVYTLWRSGELSYYKLLLMTGMDAASLNKELEGLINSKDIKLLKLGDTADCFTNIFTSNSFRLNRS